MKTLTDHQRAAGARIAAEIRSTPGFAFAAALLSRAPPTAAPPSPLGGEWTSIGWLANVVHIRFGAEISEETWAVALEEAGVEVRLHNGRAEARLSELVVLDLIDHQEDPTALAARRKRFAVFGDPQTGKAQ